jgi:phytoene dehydrogenase-like protein
MKTSFRGYRRSSGLSRIAVVGAGAAGLTAARALARRGYTATVFEQSDRVGGKCYTASTDGRDYEMGAVICFSSFGRVRRLMREHGIAESHVRLDAIYMDGEETRATTRLPTRAATSWRDLTAGAAPSWIVQ